LKSLNKCEFIGNVGSDPEVRYTGNGKAVANFSIACTDKWKDGEHTEWVRLVAWDKLAEIVGQYVHKGDPIYVEGTMRTRKYQHNDGSDRYITEIRLKELIMLGSKSTGTESVGRTRPQDPAADGSDPDSGRQPALDDGFDDIPF